MRIALGSDQSTELTAALERDLRARGYDVELLGALKPGDDDAWPSVGRRVGESVASKTCDGGIVCCWSGTGVSIAANKVPGVRAALCSDAQTSALAREWNDANVLALSLRVTPPAEVTAILDAWFATPPTADQKYRGMIEQV
jgi:ribose 5-phosphate isomerase B